jgi:Putative homoserine kinase type II (protein kinase fold)
MDKTIRKNFDQSISRDIIKRYGISGSSIQMIRFNNNFIFNVVNENDEYILRITHESQKSRELLIAENHWIDFLRKNDVLVSKPVESEYGNLIETMQHKNQTYYSLLYKKVLGKSFKSNEISPELLTKWGALLGELHNKSKGYSAEGHKHRSEEWHYDFLNPEVYLPAEKAKLIDKIILKSKKDFGNYQKR